MAILVGGGAMWKAVVFEKLAFCSEGSQRPHAHTPTIMCARSLCTSLFFAAAALRLCCRFESAVVAAKELLENRVGQVLNRARWDHPCRVGPDCAAQKRL